MFGHLLWFYSRIEIGHNQIISSSPGTISYVFWSSVRLRGTQRQQSFDTFRCFFRIWRISSAFKLKLSSIWRCHPPVFIKHIFHISNVFLISSRLKFPLRNSLYHLKMVTKLYHKTTYPYIISWSLFYSTHFTISHLIHYWAHQLIAAGIVQVWTCLNVLLFRILCHTFVSYCKTSLILFV